MTYFFQGVIFAVSIVQCHFIDSVLSDMVQNCFTSFFFH